MVFYLQLLVLSCKIFQVKNQAESEPLRSTPIKDGRTQNIDEASLGSQPQNYREQHKMDKPNKFQSLKVDGLSLVAPAESDSAAEKQLYGSADISCAGLDLLLQDNPTRAAFKMHLENDTALRTWRGS